MIGLDVDGVLANWYLSMCLRYNKAYVPLKQWSTPWLNEKYEHVMNVPIFWENLNILTPASNVLKVDAYITAIEPHLVDSRRKWLKDRNYPLAPVFATKDKVKVCKKLGIKYFLDDRQQNCEDLRAAGIICYKFIPAYMNEPRTKWDVFTLEEFYNKVKEHEDEAKEEIEV